MAIVLASTTETAENLQHGVSDGWETPPEQPEEKAAPTNGAIPLDKLPPKQFNAVREEQIRDDKDAARDALNGEVERHGRKGGGVEKRIAKAVKAWRTEESRRIAAETELAELKARFNGGAAPQTPAAPSPDDANATKPAEPQAPTQQPQPQSRPDKTQTETPTPHQQRMNEGRRKYSDFDAALKEIDGSGFRLPTKESVEALKSLPNGHEVMYLMAKNSQFRENISAKPQEAAELIRRIGGVLQLENLTNPTSWQSFNARIAELGSNKDFNPRLLLDLPEFLRPAITEEGGAGADILLHLGRNPELAREIAKMRPDAALKRLGQLSAQFTRNSRSEKVRPPEPLSPVGGSSTRSGMGLEDMPIKDFIRERNRQERQHRR